MQEILHSPKNALVDQPSGAVQTCKTSGYSAERPAWRSARAMMLLLVALLFSVASYASHYKGGQITYESMGGGTYRVTVKSYWRSTLPGSVTPSYSGSPVINTGLSTVSLTPLPDGVTVEKVEQQLVTWNQPGLYTISWTSCCRVSAGANFGQSDMGLFAAVNYDPANPSSSPQFYDLPVFNYAANIPMSFNFNNSDPENHEQVYSLNTPYGLTGSPYAAMTSTGFAVANNGTVQWTNPQQGLWLVNVKLEEKINGVLTGAYVYRDFMLNVVPTTNNAPAMTAVTPKTVQEGQPLQFNVSATDVDGNLVTLRASGLPMTMGATFVQNTTTSNPDGTFTWTPPAGSVGTYSLQFVATDNAASPLSDQITVPVTVTSPAPACNLSATAQITSVPCGNNGNQGAITISATGGSVYQYSIDGGLTYQNSNLFTNLAPGSYQVVAKEGVCTSPLQTVTIIANPLPVVTLDDFGKVCQNSGLLSLKGGQPAGGSYSGPGVSNGVFDPAVAGVGTHTISYTYINAHGCSNTTSATVRVSALPQVSLQNFGTVCMTATPFTLDQGTPPGGTYSGPGVKKNMFYPAVAGAGTHTITYSLTDTAGCSISASLDIQVIAAPIVTFRSINSVCVNSSAFSLNQCSPAGGVYSGPGVSQGAFSPASAGVGTHTITYTYSANGCTATATQTITVSSPVSATLNAFGKVCKNSGLLTLTGGQPAGGTYSGPGVSNGVFDPAVAGVGTHTITYSCNSNGCSSTKSATIQVNALAQVSLQNLGTVCISAAPFALSQGAPKGGNYSGPGVVKNKFYPAVAGAGTHTITYTLADVSGCPVSVSVDIKVVALPGVTFGTMNNVCAYASAFTLTQGSPAGGVYSGPGVFKGVFSPTSAGFGTHKLTYTYSSNGCTASATQTITVNAPLTVSAGTDKSVVKGYAPKASVTVTASANGGSGNFKYRWNTGATTASITVNPSATTTYTVSCTDAAGCSVSDQVRVAVTDASCGSKNDKVLVCHNGQELCIAASAVAAHLAHGDNLGSCQTSQGGCSGRDDHDYDNGNGGCGNGNGNGNGHDNDDDNDHNDCDNNNHGGCNRLAGGVATGSEIMLGVSPNPFTQIATLNFMLPASGDFTLEVYDLKGSLVQRIQAGTGNANQLYSASIDGSQWPAGVYLARLVTGGEVKTTKLILHK